MPDSTAQKLEELDRQLSTMRRERDRLAGEARIWLERRNTANEQVRTLRSEARAIKEKRDAANQKVQDLKALREQAKTEQQEKRNQLTKARERTRIILEKKPSRSLADIQKEIEALDWKVQTTSLSVKDEKALVDKIRNLENQRSIHKQSMELKDELLILQTEERALATRAKLSHKRLAEMAKQSQEFHEQMAKVLKKAQELEAEADNAHQKYVGFRRRATEHHQKYVELLQQIRLVKQEIRKKDEEQQGIRQQELREKAIQGAQEKMKRGEKLTLEEFKLLAEQGSV